MKGVKILLSNPKFSSQKSRALAHNAQFFFDILKNLKERGSTASIKDLRGHSITMWTR